MSITNKELIDKLITLVLTDANTRKENAGYDGRWDDGGGGRLEEQVKFYQYGLQATIPPEWEQYKKLLDPEYLEYLRLKRKFG